MKRYSLHFLAAVLLAALTWVGCNTDRGPLAPSGEPAIEVAAKPAAEVAAAIAVQNRHTDRLLAIPGVVGTATGLRSDGSLAIKVLTEAGRGAGIPTDLEGIPVEVEVTGKIVALGEPVGKTGNGGGSTLTTTSRWPRPVPIGVSTGNEGECSAGTISCRVKDALGNVYALSNNHVYALENKAPLGSNVLQPGRYDTGCSFDPNNIIGSLAGFEPIMFGSDNTIDAAIASSSTVNLGNATPSGGYGTPNSTTAAASLSQKVQKYGRTTALTKGQVTGINVTVSVGYSAGTARFVNQIMVQGTKPFIKAGDSGSLLVTDPGKNPVGLLFAGTSNGIAIANPIGPVLSRFGVTVDGQ